MSILKMRNLALILIAGILLVGGIAVGFFLSEKNQKVPVTTLAHSEEYEETQDEKAKEKTTKIKTFNGSVVEKRNISDPIGSSEASQADTQNPSITTQGKTTSVQSTAAHNTVTDPKATKAPKPATTKSPYPTIKLTVRHSTSLDLSKIPANAEVNFRSTSPSVAGVDDRGIVTGRSSGECYIYATYKQNMKNYTVTYFVIVE